MSYESNTYPPMNRIVITACSQSKKASEDLIPAIQRYDGPSFRLLRKYINKGPDDLDIFILSAKFGLLTYQTEIPFYDQTLNKKRVEDLSILALDQARELIYCKHRNREIFVNLGKTYLEAFQPALNQIADLNSLTVASGSSGRRLSELHDWLYGEESRLLTDIANTTVDKGAWFKGKLIHLNESDLRLILRRGIANGEQDLIKNFQSWFVFVDGVKVSPKWLVSKVTGFPVGKFHSDEARKLIGKLGIEVHRV